MYLNVYKWLDFGKQTIDECFTFDIVYICVYSRPSILYYWLRSVCMVKTIIDNLKYCSNTGNIS